MNLRKHLGFSTHVRTENLEEVLDFLGDRIEFCQIQLNYVDWTLQDAKRKIEILGSRGIPVMVMEPLRGGKLKDLGEENNSRLKAARGDESIASWSFRWLMRIPEVATVLSGMSSIEQMKDNIKTFSWGRALSEEEWNMMLDIPMLLEGFNDLKFASAMTVKMQMDGTPAEKWPDKCIGCGACAAVCPQHIDIPEVLKEYNEMLHAGPTWAEMCRQREEAAEKMRKS